MTNVITLGVYLIDNIYRINASTMTDKYALASENFVVFLNQNVNIQKLGQKTLDVLHKPRIIMPHPKDSHERREQLKEWYNAMQIKSWKYVVQNGKVININLKEGQIYLSATKPDSKGFGPSSKPNRICIDGDPIALGQGILDTFDDCE